MVGSFGRGRRHSRKADAAVVGHVLFYPVAGLSNNRVES
jgi:hypothetical protein